MRRALLAAVIFIGLFAASASPAAAEPVEILASWGDEPTQIDRPNAVAVDRSGNVFVADDNDGYISKFASDGTFISRFGELGWAPGQLGPRVGLAASEAGDVYVTDSDTNRVEQFTNGGTFVRQWGSGGDANGQFEFGGKSAGIAVDGDGHVFVADRGNARVQKFSPDGQFLDAWGHVGWQNPGELSDPSSVAVDASGSVYVADSGNRRVQKFSNDGTFESMITWDQDAPAHPGWVGVGPSGVLSVGVGLGRIEQFGPDGTFLRKWSAGVVSGGSSPGVDNLGNLYFPDNFTSQVLKLSETGSQLQTFSSTSLKLGPSEFIQDADSDGHGGVWVLDIGHRRVVHFTADGDFLGDVRPSGDRGGVSAIAADHDGNVYLAVSGLCQIDGRCLASILKFNTQGQLVSTIGPIFSPGYLSLPKKLSVDRSNNVYILDGSATSGGTQYVAKLNSAGSFVSSWPVPGAAFDLAAEDSGNVLLTNQDRGAVQRFDPDGKLIAQWPVAVDETNVGRIEVDPEGQIYVGLANLPRIAIFTASGSLIRYTGSDLPTNAESPFHTIDAFAIGTAGDMFAVDPLDKQVKRFRPIPDFVRIATENLPRSQAGRPYSASLAATGGTAPHTWRIASGALPAGLSLSESGQISGTATKATQATVTFEAEDSHGETAKRTLTVYVELVVMTPSSLPPATLAKSYSTTLKATGGAGLGYKWAISSGALPAGLKLYSNGTISGTPTAPGDFEFTSKVSDGGKPVNTATRQFSLAVSPMAITTTSVPSGLVGKAYPSTTLKVVGGKASYKWSVSAGGLPTGLKLSTTGTLSGTPSASGDFTFTAKATDASVPANSVERQFNLAVSPMTIVTTTVPNGVVGKAYTSTTLKGSGGKGALVWSLDSGALPPGLRLSASGNISGTPTVAGTYAFVVKLADSSTPKNYATKPLTIAIN